MLRVSSSATATSRSRFSGTLRPRPFSAVRRAVRARRESFNPALRLYQRLGFEHVDTNGVYYLMRWTPPQVKTAS